MIKWFLEVAPIGRKLNIALGAVVAPMAATWAVTGLEYARLSQAATREVASNYLQMLRFGMETTLGVSTAAMLASLVACLWLRGRLTTPVTAAVLELENLAAGDLSEPAWAPRRADEAGRVIAAAAILRRNAIAARRAADDYAAREDAAAAERERVMAALAEGLGALAATNRQLRGGGPVSPAPAALRPAPSEVVARAMECHIAEPDDEPVEDGLIALLRRLDHRRPADGGLRLVTA